MTDRKANRLYQIASDSAGFAAPAEETFRAMRHGKGHPMELLNDLALDMCDKYNLASQIQHNMVMFMDPASRSEQPPYILVSLNAGQGNLPQARYSRFGAFSIIDMVEAGWGE